MCNHPILGDLRPTGLNDGFYRILRHEVGVNEIDGSSQNVVKASFTTPDMTLLKAQEPMTNAIEGMLFEPDFQQSGDLKMTVRGNANSRDKERVSSTYTIKAPGDGVPTADQVVRLKDAHRQMRITFESNTIGGDFRMGQPYLHIQPGDRTETS
jgi:hypothetical protein